MKNQKLRLKPEPREAQQPPEFPEPRETPGSISGVSDEDLADPEVFVGEPSKPAEDSHLADWSGRDVFFGFPCYKHTNPATAWCLLASALDHGKEKLRFDLELGDAMIYHARNRLAHKFLETGAKWLLFVDDDMIFPVGRPAFMRQMGRLPDSYPDAPLALDSVTRLLSHGLPLVGATYYTRNRDGVAVNSLRQNDAYLRSARQFENRALPCEWTGTGMMLVERSVFAAIQEKFPELETNMDPKAPWDFFLPGPGQGEDVAFCQRAKAAGVQPHVDTMLHCLHVGYGVYGVHTALRT